MSFEAKILADSISEAGVRLTTFQLRYPRMIHAELMTHRVFSRNASSSRAIPVAKMIEDIRQDPAMPVYWGSNKPGMQAGEELTGQDLEDAKAEHLAGMEDAIARAQRQIARGLHKQIANRTLEPWGHINVVVTATDYENFFILRCHETAQPEIKVVADMMRGRMATSEPQLLKEGEWHLPYISAGELAINGINVCKKVSVARCARVSYMTHDGKQTTIQEDYALYERLLGAQPLHASPAEHQATPDQYEEHEGLGFVTGWQHEHQHGNLRGWRQLRKMLPGEFIPG